jgi:N-acetylglucosamine-6-sulfatase
MRVLVALLLLLLLPCAAVAKPNIVVIMTDDDAVSSLPYLSKVQELFAAEGVSFNNAYCANPLCAPDRATFLTGLYAHNHNVWHVSNGWTQYKAGGYQQNSLPRWLKESGYQTALIGKYINKFNSLNGKPLYWDEFVAPIEDPDTSLYYNYSVNINAVVEQKGSAAEDYSTDFYGNRAVDFIAGATEPFFLLYAPHGPHATADYPIPAPRHVNATVAPFPVPPNFASGAYTLEQTKELWKLRLQAMLSVEEQIEAIVNAAPANTVFIFFSDNGFCLGENGKFRKQFAQDCSAKTYLLMRGPGIPQGETRNHLVSTVDLTATICEMAECDRQTDGRSLWPIVQDATAPWRTSLLIESNDQQAYSAVHRTRMKYIENADGSQELYDLQLDPGETQNKINDPAHAFRLPTLRNELNALRACDGAACWR